MSKAASKEIIWCPKVAHRVTPEGPEAKAWRQCKVWDYMSPQERQQYPTKDAAGVCFVKPFLRISQSEILKWYEGKEDVVKMKRRRKPPKNKLRTNYITYLDDINVSSLEFLGILELSSRDSQRCQFLWLQRCVC